jgi:hypothetical protein
MALLVELLRGFAKGRPQQNETLAAVKLPLRVGRQWATAVHGKVRTPVRLKGRATVGGAAELLVMGLTFKLNQSSGGNAAEPRQSSTDPRFLSWVGWFDRQDEKSEHELLSKVGSQVSIIPTSKWTNVG